MKMRRRQDRRGRFMGWWWRLHAVSEDAGSIGPLWKQGRAWLNLSQREWDHSDRQIACEWVLGKWREFDLNLRVGGPLADDDAVLHLGIPGLSVWLSIERFLPERIRWMEEREIGWLIHNGSIWLHVWSTPDRWSNAVSFWDASSKIRQPVLHVENWIKGKEHYVERVLGIVRMDVVLPEGRYPATVELIAATRRRARWPGGKQVRRARITLDTPIPIPGKGENAWDMGDDATHSATISASTPLAAVEHLAANILSTRERRAGRGWVPAEGWPATIR